MRHAKRGERESAFDTIGMPRVEIAQSWEQDAVCQLPSDARALAIVPIVVCHEKRERERESGERAGSRPFLSLLIRRIENPALLLLSWISFLLPIIRDPVRHEWMKCNLMKLRFSLVFCLKSEEKLFLSNRLRCDRHLIALLSLCPIV